MSVRLRARSGKARPGGLFGMRLAAQAAPARSPTRPPIGYWRWVAGWGSGPVPLRKSLFRDFSNRLSGGRAFLRAIGEAIAQLLELGRDMRDAIRIAMAVALPICMLIVLGRRSGDSRVGNTGSNRRQVRI